MNYILLKVPRYKQKRNTCGVTALRMVLAHFAQEVSEREIIQAVGGLKKYGVRTVKLAYVADKLGFKTSYFSLNRKLADGNAKIKLPEVRDILNFLKKEIPVIINVRSSLLYDEKPTTQGHFIVITGYKDGRFVYNDPYDGKSHRIAEEKLRFAWFNNVLDSSAYLLAIWPK